LHASRHRHFSAEIGPAGSAVSVSAHGGRPSQPIPVSLGGDDVELTTPNPWFGTIVDASSAMNAFFLMDRLPPKNLRN